MARRTPNLWLNVWNNFRDSFKPRQTKGNLMGEDHLGTKYFEIPPNPAIGKRRAQRWFLARSGDFEQNLPAEWEAWLRYRRSEPPGQEELEKNRAIMEMKRVNGAAVEARALQARIERGEAPTPDEKGRYSYPKYGDEYSHSGKPRE